MTQTASTHAGFWDRMARKYRAQPISDMTAYQQTLDRVITYLSPSSRALELGCGTGGTALELAPFLGEIVATDFSAGMIAQAEAREGAENVRFLHADVFDGVLEPGAFDVVMAFNLLHLIDDIDVSLARIHALLPPGGLFISKSPCLGEPRLGFKFGLMRRMIPLMQRVGKAPFVRYDTIAGLEARIAQAGFDIVETGNYPIRPPNHFVVARRL
ncbi:class I SAM-dependent methyltransferase [uncultured Tateyamaria sp.]|uniref:class I SAM-dependent methyltransferase n=1 Tax=uncultured Tateyamaria sp. TaxID=455651 RepID=UPI00261FB8B3|nr:class I SAM-dependent methyltransferase [uncultured Tateyamaria sp.]